MEAMRVPSCVLKQKKGAMVPLFLQHVEGGPKRSDCFLISMIHEFSLCYHHGVDRISTFQLVFFGDS